MIYHVRFTKDGKQIQRKVEINSRVGVKKVFNRKIELGNDNYIEQKSLKSKEITNIVFEDSKPAPKNHFQ
ncbi:hypothetical protein [Helicobacter sp. 11S03491-1]|uniref:hypothetical protein n=1 Tax=Helicobacter sp. 11S03491-1 TaxID=1476196 RepID=UPI000BA7E3FF|nr:hypothetical protein [Helicobacter sp. 11S03491-1]PAF41351.1 hypothetical protein BKH45_07565 [Helicobacter sp. 11S03491-1]